MLICGKSAWKALLYFCNVFISLKLLKNNMKNWKNKIKKLLILIAKIHKYKSIPHKCFTLYIKLRQCLFGVLHSNCPPLRQKEYQTWNSASASPNIVQLTYSAVPWTVFICLVHLYTTCSWSPLRVLGNISA